MAGKLSGSAIQSNTITVTQLSTTTVTTIVNQTGPRVTSLVYPGNDTAGNTVGGQTVYINGSGFETNNAIYINGNAVPSKSFISASNLSFTTPALSAGIYPVYVINTDSGSTAIFVPGYIASAEPAWVTSAGSLNASQDEGSAWSYSLSATGDAPITYALAGGSSLPSGISLAANGLISGTLSSLPGTETTYTFSVVASDAQNQDSTRQFTVTTTSGEGALFANNVLLIHADGTNNQNNHAFLDSSNNNFTITRYGNATQGSFSPFSQTGWSNYFDGDNDTLRMSGNVLSGAGNVTIECWVYPETSSVVGLFDGGPGQAGVIRNYPANSIEEQGSGTAATFSLTPNTWSHFAATFNNGVIKVYVNGVNTGNGTYTGDYTVGTNFDIGGINGGADGDFKGYISNFRVTKSIVYSSNFTPSTTPLSAIANTTLLTCQSNRFIDNSNNAYAITRNGNPLIQVWSPFAPTAAYSTANVGGSVYLDGSGDYLSAPDNAAYDFGTGDFTVESWIYPTTASGVRILVGHYSGSDGFSLELTNTNTLTLWLEGSTIATSTGTVTANAWNHVAVSRSGTSLRLFINGAVDGTATNSTNISGSTSALYISSSASTPGAGVFTGYMSGVRVVKGTAVYTGAFTPPTAPLTNIANTSLLCNFTNAGIFDQTAKNILETIGDAKISTSVYKYGTGSVVFDGTDDRLLIPTSPNLAFGTGNFTIEAWVNRTASGSVTHFIDFRGSNNNGSNPVFYWQTNNYLYYTNDNSSGDNQIQSSNAITSSSGWVHVAIVRSGTTLTVYVNGVASGSVTYSTNVLGGNPVTIGNRFNNSGAYAGYIDDLRITKGYARYTSNFTAPTSAFKDK
jgi:hypothetical protein